MIEEYNKTLQLFKNQKNLLLEKTNKKNKDPDLLNNIINQICILDNKIKECNNLIKNENNKDKHIYNNKNNNNIDNHNDYNNDEKLSNNNSLNYQNKKKKKFMIK